MLLNVHGGPHTQYGETFFDEGAGPGRRRLRRAHEQPARRIRSRAVVGAVDPWAQAPAPHRDPAGAASTSTTCMAVLDTALQRYPFCDARPGRHDRRQLRRLHGHVVGRLPRRPIQGDLQRAGGQQHDHRGVHQRHRHGVPGRGRPEPDRRPRGVQRGSRRSASCATSTCRC